VFLTLMGSYALFRFLTEFLRADHRGSWIGTFSFAQGGISGSWTGAIGNLDRSEKVSLAHPDRIVGRDVQVSGPPGSPGPIRERNLDCLCHDHR